MDIHLDATAQDWLDGLTVIVLVNFFIAVMVNYWR
jgi:hypothetical protein